MNSYWYYKNGTNDKISPCRILGFYRAPPVVGRNVNLEEEIEPIGDKKLMDTFFKKGKTALN